jgi:GTPase SAR1 family protein
MIDHQFDKTYKVILVGDNLIGKSSFLDRYADGTFPSDHYSSVIRIIEIM